MDLIVLVVGGVGAYYAFGIDAWYGVAIVFTVAHFFLLHFSWHLEYSPMDQPSCG